MPKFGCVLFKQTYPELYKANLEAIKEIATQIIDACAEESKTELTSTCIRVDKDSIKNVYNQIKF